MIYPILKGKVWCFMTVLPTIDLGLMAEHLSAHEGILNKLALYETKVTNTVLKEIIILQINVMQSHVKAMLALINPDHSGYVELPHLNEYNINGYWQVLKESGHFDNNKWIALESYNTAKSMSNENYISSLMMKNQNVRIIHAQMALQQFALQSKYAELIKEMGWAFVPYATVQEQINTYQHYQYILIQ